MSAPVDQPADECADGGCDEVLAELERFLDGETADAQVATVRTHLANCDPCTDRADFERHVRDLVKRRCLEEAAPPGLFDRLRACLDDVGPVQAGS